MSTPATKLTKTHSGRYGVDGHGTDASVWVVKDGAEWHVMRWTALGGTAWITSGATRADALANAADNGWR